MQNSTINPINHELKAEVIEATFEHIDTAATIFNRPFRKIEVLFDLRGQAAGMYRIIGKSKSIRYNPWIFSKYFAENLSNTVPHEVAHYIIYEIYARKQVRPHGSEWKDLMQAFGANPARTFDHDLSGIPMVKHKTYPYRCQCRAHSLTARRHNQIVRGKKTYFCRQCQALLIGQAV